MKTQLFPALLLVCATMSGQTGLGILRPSLLELTKTAAAFDAKVKEANTEIGPAFDAKVKEAYKDYPLPDSLSYDYLNSDEISNDIKEVRDVAERRWDKFIGLCRSYSYGKALDCYLENFADFFVYLRFSADRYEFLSSILLPLMRECRGEEFARKRYIEDLSFEKGNEEFMIALNEGNGEGYVPEVYPDVVRDLGHALAEDGSAPSDSMSAIGKTRSIYYWKTTFKIGKGELAFLSGHSITRLYLRMFDVDAQMDYATGRTTVVPVASVKFKTPKPDSLEIVPTVFITLDALRHYENDENALASLIAKRVLNMCSYHDLGPIREIQFDCDWTAATRKMFEKLCTATKEILHPQGILLSGTIRLHQIAQAEYPFDRGVLMLYNTGAVKDPGTRNSIIAYEDIHTYLWPKDKVTGFLKARKTNCPEIAIAYPAYSWMVAFKSDGSFDGILPTLELDPNPQIQRKLGGGYEVTGRCNVRGFSLELGQTIRPEASDFSEIAKVKSLVDKTLGEGHSNIIFHLDLQNLSKYSHEEIETMLR